MKCFLLWVITQVIKETLRQVLCWTSSLQTWKIGQEWESQEQPSLQEPWDGGAKHTERGMRQKSRITALGFYKSWFCPWHRPAWRTLMGCGPWEKKGPGKLVNFAESLLPSSRTVHPNVQKIKSRWQEACMDWEEGKTHKTPTWEGIGELKARWEETQVCLNGKAKA